MSVPRSFGNLLLYFQGSEAQRRKAAKKELQADMQSLQHSPLKLGQTDADSPDEIA